MHGVLEYEVFNLAFLEPLDQDIIEGIFWRHLRLRFQSILLSYVCTFVISLSVYFIYLYIVRLAMVIFLLFLINFL